MCNVQYICMYLCVCVCACVCVCVCVCVYRLASYCEGEYKSNQSLTHRIIIMYGSGMHIEPEASVVHV